jgi:hypothetical protein
VTTGWRRRATGRAAARAAALAAALAAVASCGQEGTLSVSLVFPPGTSRLPAAAQTVRLTLAVPGAAPEVREASVSPDGSFQLSVAVPAGGGAATVTLEALDAGGLVLARGLSPPLPLTALDDTLALYLAPPLSFAAAPVALPQAVAELAAAPLSYGVVFAGGRNADGSRSDALEIYSLYHHRLFPGAHLPAPRAELLAVADRFDLVTLFGGLGIGEAPTADLLRFDTTVAPAGAYTTLSADPSLARAGVQAAPIGGDRYVVTGAPPILIDARAGTATAMANGQGGVTGATAASTTATSAGGAVVVLTGPTGAFRYDAAADQFAQVSPIARSEQAQVALPGGDVLVVGPGTEALRISAAGAVTPTELLAVPRRRPAVAVAGTTLVVAGGFDAGGNALPDAELFDAATLAPRGGIPLVVPRGAATAVSLPNTCVLLVGGRSAVSGSPTATLEIFTP